MQTNSETGAGEKERPIQDGDDKDFDVFEVSNPNLQTKGTSVDLTQEEGNTEKGKIMCYLIYYNLCCNRR